MLEKTGIPTQSQIESVFPDETRLQQGPVAVIECFQLIPCDPCATSCPQQAIQPFIDINSIPVIDNHKCNGCGICITKCPGLAIMVVDMTWSESRALIKLPYEFRPLPEAGQIVHALDRAGAIIAKAEVVRVTLPKSKTPIVSIAVDKALVKAVRNICIRAVDIAAGDCATATEVIPHTVDTLAMPPHNTENPDPGIICRCSDIGIEEIREYIAQGYTSVDELKRFTRLGMGPCQGRTCIPLVMRELSNALQKPIDSFSPGTYRPVVKSIKLGDLAAYSQEEVQHD